MSGASIPYQLRPNKFIDREVFIDLLGRVIPNIGADKYVYLSMGGKHLVDHTAAYRKVGLRNLFSFDVDPEIVRRQNFNRPIDSVICRELDSGNLSGQIDVIMADFPIATNVIVWLDYTDPHARLTQLQELIEIASRLQPGDVLRVTLNASLATLEPHQEAWKSAGYKNPGKYRAAQLRSQLGSFVPSGVDAIGETEFAKVLCECVSLAISSAEPVLNNNIVLEPVLLTSYRDGQRMMTATIFARSIDEAVPGLNGWEFKPEAWSDLTVIDAPDLSLREKLTIDTKLSQDASEVVGGLGFLPGKNMSQSVEYIRSYQKLHRYYPAFHHVDA